MFRASARLWKRILQAARPCSAYRAPGAGGPGRAPNALDVLFLAMQLIQMLPTFWAATLLVGLGTWIDSLLAAALLLLIAPATWWLLRIWRSSRRELPDGVPAGPYGAAGSYGQAAPDLPRMRRPALGADPYRRPDDGSTLERLHDDVVALVRASLRRDPVQLLPDIENTTRRILVLLEEGQYPRHLDRLRLLAGMSLCVATDNDLNLGNRRGAATNVRLARAYAEIIGHRPLQAWCCSVQSWILAVDGLPQKAALLAVSGQQFATTAVARRRLHGMHGNALALMGDKRRALRAFDLARLERLDVEESDDIVDRVGGVFSAPLAKQYQNAAYGLTRLGLFGKATAAAEKAIQLYAHGPDDERDYVLESGARVSLAVSYAMRRRLDAASETLRPILDLPPNRRAEYIRMLMADLQRVLATPRFNRSNEAANLKTELEEFALDRPGRSGGR